MTIICFMYCFSKDFCRNTKNNKNKNRYRLLFLRKLYVCANSSGAEGGSRTHTRFEPHWILSPARLPIPPLRHVFGEHWLLYSKPKKNARGILIKFLPWEYKYMFLFIFYKVYVILSISIVHCTFNCYYYNIYVTVAAGGEANLCWMKKDW